MRSQTLREGKKKTLAHITVVCGVTDNNDIYLRRGARGSRYARDSHLIRLSFHPLLR